MHESHALYQKLGVFWCLKCGNYAAGRLVRSLGTPCLGAPARAGSDVVRRLARGLTPIVRMLDWPMTAAIAPPEGRFVCGRSSLSLQILAVRAQLESGGSESSFHVVNSVI